MAFLRRQDHWLASHYAQISDREGGGSQAGFAAMVERTLDPARDRHGFGMLLDYGALHAALAAVAGRGGECSCCRTRRWSPSPSDCCAASSPGSARPRTAVPTLLAAAAGRANVRGEAAGGVPSWRLRPPSLALGGGRRVAVPSRLWPARRIALAPGLSARILAAYAEGNARAAAAAGLDLAAYGYLPAVYRCAPPAAAFADA